MPLLQPLLLSALALATAPDGAPLQRYLSPERLEALLSPESVEWSSCVPEPLDEPFQVRLSLRVLPTGAAEAVTATTDGAPAPCWSALLTAVAFPAHDEDPLEMEFSLAVHTGGVVGPGGLTLLARELGPLFLLLPLDAAERQRLIRALDTSAEIP